MELNLSQIKLSNHAISRALERMEIQENTRHEKVCRHVKKQLEKATYIGRITTSEGDESEMYVKGSFGFMLNTELTTIKTVLKFDRLPYNPAHEKIKCLIHKEFRKLDRSEKAKTRQLELFKYEAELEISQLKLRCYKSKSQSVKMACQARITALKTRLQELENQIYQIKTDKRQVAYVLASAI